MDQDSNPPPNNNSASISSNNGTSERPSFRMRRPSSSLISSTTPMFPAPTNPLLRSSITQRGSSSSTSFQPQLMQLHHHHQQQRDIDDDDQPSSSSPAPSFTAPSLRQRTGVGSIVMANNSSNYGNTTRSSSPLGSPDSTIWGPSPSPGPVNSNPYRNSNSHRNTTNQSIGGPPTPGGHCVVSSSTVEDDIPPSPFSPVAEDNVSEQSISNRNNSNSSNLASVANSPSVNDVIITGGNRNENESIPSSPGPPSSSSIFQSSITRGNNNPSGAEINSGPSSSAARASSSSGSSHGQYSSNFSVPSSSYLTPLRNKIKKATSFEIFSAQAQASINNNNSTNSSSTTITSDSSIKESRQNGSSPSKAIIKSLLGSASGTSPAATTATASVPGPSSSRLVWDYLPNNNNNNTTDNASNENSRTSTSNSNSIFAKPNNLTSSSSSVAPTTANNVEDDASDIPLQFNSKPYLIKKFAAKIAARFSKEQEQLLEGPSSSSSSSCAGTSGQFSSIRNPVTHTNKSTASLSAAAAALTNNLMGTTGLNEESPLNLTDNSLTSNTASTSASISSSVVRNPISSKSFSKKIPMPPKQKILLRMQSGELFDGLSPPPPPVSSIHSSALLTPQSSHHQSTSASRRSPPPQSSVLSSSQIQQQQSQMVQQEHILPAIHHQLLHETLQQQQQGLIDSLSLQQHSPQPGLGIDRYSSISNYDAFSRANIEGNSNDDFSNVQDVLSKSEMDCSSDPNIQVLYDDVADAYAYYYGNILNDEIFSSTVGGNAAIPQPPPSNQRPLLMMSNNNLTGGPSSGLQEDMASLFQNQQHGHLEFPIGMTMANEDALHQQQQQQHERLIAGSTRDDVESLKQELSEVSMQTSNGSQHVQFLDPNDPKLQGDSTLRNLLMMQPLRSHDDSWLSSAAEYQSLRNLNPTPSSVGGLATNSILGNALLMNMVGSNNGNLSTSTSANNWMGDWPPRWQQHQQHEQQTDDDSGGDQDEVMDMSIMDIEKSHNLNSHGSSIIVKHGGSHGQQALIDHNAPENLSLDDVDLVSDRELVAVAGLHGIPLDLQLQQQPLNVLPKGQNGLMEPSLSQAEAMLLRNHAAMEAQHGNVRSVSTDDEEPVNLIASANSEQQFSLQHHSNRHSNSHHNMNDGLSNGTSCIISTQDVNSCVTILTTTSSTTVATTTSHSPGSLGQGFDLMMNGDCFNDKRVIRYKKVKESSITSSEAFSLKNNGSSNTNPATSPTGTATIAANFIPDKPVQPKAFGSLPSPLNLVRGEDNHWRVYNRSKTIPCNTRFGPVEGPMKKVYEDDLINISSAIYPYLVLVDSSNILWHLDRTHDELCNWMKFIRLARTADEQNALISECSGFIYVTTCRDISPKVELRVGYSFEYAQKFSFPYIPPTSSLAATSNDYNSDSNYQNDRTEMDQHESPSVLTVEKQHKPSNSNGSKIIVSFPCFECDTEFSTVDELTKHLNSVHDNEESDEEIIRRPKKKVLKKYYNSENIVPNSEKAVPNINMNDKNDLPPKSSSISISSETNKAQNSSLAIPLSCQNCGNDFEIQDKLDSHIQGCNFVKEIIGSKYERFPRKKAAMENALVQDSSPLTSSNPAASALSTNNNENNIPMLASSIITTTAIVSSDIRKKNKCTICYKNFATKDRLEKHMIVHSDDDLKPLKCPSCSKRFLTNSALAGHVKTHAEEGKCFDCPMCEFSTQQLLQLKDHVQTHRRKESGLFHCHRCPKKFSQYAMIRKHIRAFHGPKMFACDFLHCSMTFPSADKLKLHKLKHSDHREFLCAECGRQFKRRDKLVEHTKRMHDENSKRKVEVETPPPIVTRKIKQEKKIIPKVSMEEFEKFTYKCAECMVGFKRRGMLVNHLAKRHPEKPPTTVPELNLPILKTTRNFFCLYCDRVYKSSSKRKAHILKAHPGKPLPPQLRGRLSGKEKDETLQPSKDEKMDVSDAKPDSCVRSDENGVSASGIQSQKFTLFNDAGKVVANPHACQWCHRQYATRAKLLQHQRKAHLHLMPLEIQLPRTQKNNVQRNIKAEPAGSSESDKIQQSNQCSKTSQQEIVQQQQNLQTQSQPVFVQSNDMQDASLPHVSGSDEVIGFFLTTSISEGELASFLPIVVPMSSLASTVNNEAIASITSTTNCSTINMNPVTTVSYVPNVSPGSSSSSSIELILS